jgi:hypothetical protein
VWWTVPADDRSPRCLLGKGHDVARLSAQRTQAPKPQPLPQCSVPCFSASACCQPWPPTPQTVEPSSAGNVHQMPPPQQPPWFKIKSKTVLCPCCSAGAHRQFTRRKQDSVCVQGGDYKRPQPDVKPCACTAADVECDYGFVSGADGTCKALPHVSVGFLGFAGRACVDARSSCPKQWGFERVCMGSRFYGVKGHPLKRSRSRWFFSARAAVEPIACSVHTPPGPDCGAFALLQCMRGVTCWCAC